MKNKNDPRRKTELSREQRNRRIQQIVMSVLGLILILSMILALTARF
ncbi:MAG TPA: hypothetical protein VMT46_11805 [Anaerolineaceae bacterium]|nr:hypothetical protein [Anaerolineaceae bacterium]